MNFTIKDKSIPRERWQVSFIETKAAQNAAHSKSLPAENVFKQPESAAATLIKAGKSTH